MVSRIISKIGLKKARDIVGVDIGATSIKMCLLHRTKEGTFSLSAMAQRSYEEDLLHDGSIVNSGFVARELKSMLGASSIKTRLAASALSSYSVITKRVSMPFLEKEALESAIRIEVENIIPFPLNEIYYSYYKMGADEDREGMMNLLIVAAKKEIVEDYIRTFDQAGLDLAVLDVDIFAVTNLVEHIYRPKGFSVLAADVGASVTNIAIVKDLDIEFTREILVGGKFVTNEIAKSHNLTYREAEEQKLGMKDAAAPFLEDFVSNVSSEINKTINFYLATKPRETVGAIYLTGGSSRVVGLKEQIERETGINVEFLNPALFLANGGSSGMDEAQGFCVPVALYLSTRTDEN